MSIDDSHAIERPGVDWRRAEFVLTGIAFLGFVTLAVRITTVYSGLPAHPLFVHVPVILIPTAVVAALVFVARPEWLGRYGIALCLVSIVAMSSIFLTMQAGGALRGELHLQGEAAALISEHSQAANILAIVFTAFTAILILTFAAYRISGGRPTGLGVVDRLLGSRSRPLRQSGLGRTASGRPERARQAHRPLTSAASPGRLPPLLSPALRRTASRFFRLRRTAFRAIRVRTPSSRR